MESPTTKSIRRDWLSNISNDLLAGLVVALAPIPEGIAFAIIAGVDPKVGLNEASRTLVDRFAVHDKPDAVEQPMGH